jgi:hypothetical protein
MCCLRMVHGVRCVLCIWDSTKLQCPCFTVPSNFGCRHYTRLSEELGNPCMCTSCHFWRPVHRPLLAAGFHSDTWSCISQQQPAICRASIARSQVLHHCSCWALDVGQPLFLWGGCGCQASRQAGKVGIAPQGWSIQSPLDQLQVQRHSPRRATCGWLPTTPVCEQGVQSLHNPQSSGCFDFQRSLLSMLVARDVLCGHCPSGCLPVRNTPGCRGG